MVARRLSPSIALAAVGALAALAPAAGAQSLAREAGADGVVARHAQTQKVRFVGTAPGRPIPRQAGVPATARPETAARAFVRAHAAELGARADDLVATETRRPGGKRASVRFQQRHRGVPVLAGELVVNLDRERNVLSAGGELLPSPDLSTSPAVTAAAARATALQSLAGERRVNAALLDVAQPELAIFDNRLLGGPGTGEPVLVWRTEVTGPAVRELVLVDARTGTVALSIDQIAHAKNRKVCDANNLAVSYPCEFPQRIEGGPPTGTPDVDRAYDLSGQTYDFFHSRFGRDGIDGAGMPLVSTVRWCDPSFIIPCPYPNAFWDGSQMVYGQGYAVDDVVGHELAHGVTEFTSGLFYYYQSGAINESFSDVIGELLDLTNGEGTDTAETRWLVGEEIPRGAIRDMEHPPAFNHPDRMRSPHYFWDVGDEGGVHLNSGVNNKAAFLLTDGGTFNGRKVSPLGPDKVVRLYYETMTTLLTSGSDYADLFHLLPQACRNLAGEAGTGMTATDCVEVEDAVKATEMDLPPVAAAPPQAPQCAANQTASYVMNETFDTAPVAWTPEAIYLFSMWSVSDAYANSGRYSLHAKTERGLNDSAMRMNAPVTIPRKAFMWFQHAYDFEGDHPINRFDGGVIEYSVAGGPWTDAGPLITHHGYNHKLYHENPMGERWAFTSHSDGYGSSRLDLSALAGKAVRFRFRVGTSGSVGDVGWYIDDVRIGTCRTHAPAGGRGASASPTAKGDFDGDGVGDVAIGVPGDNDAAGGVQVLYGTPTGLAAGRSQLWSQSSAGVADAAETGDGFGASLAVGDFDGDGKADLAIGAPGENGGGGAVHVLYGTASGLSAANSQLWDQESAGVPDAQEAGDELGFALAAANLGNSAHADLAIGAPGEDRAAGKVQVLYGSAGRLSAAGTQEWSEAPADIASTPVAGDRFGASLAAADFGGAAVGDLAVGVPGTQSGAGAVHALYGAATGGLSAAGSQYWSQANVNIPDSQEAGDGFGLALAAVDLGRTGQADLAIGAPGEDAGAGAVHVLYGAASALSLTQNQMWSQSATNIFDAPEAGDRFGAALAAADLGKTAFGDLAIGVPGENGDGGAVHVLYGSATSGATSAGAQFWSQNSSGIADLQAAGDDFGAALAAIDLGRGAQSDLVVGAPGEDADAGQAHVIYGSSSGLAAAGSQAWTQNSSGLAGTALAGDRFGAGLGN